MRGINAFLAIDAFYVAKLNTRRLPSCLKCHHKAVQVKNMSALDHHTWSEIQSFTIANCAVVIPSFPSRGFVVILYAIWVKAG
jgi:hypothetical protein